MEVVVEVLGVGHANLPVSECSSPPPRLDQVIVGFAHNNADVPDKIFRTGQTLPLSWSFDWVAASSLPHVRKRKHVTLIGNDASFALVCVMRRKSGDGRHGTKLYHAQVPTNFVGSFEDEGGCHPGHRGPG